MTYISHKWYHKVSLRVRNYLKPVRYESPEEDIPKSDEEYVKIQNDPYIKYYRLPEPSGFHFDLFLKYSLVSGFNAGRALLISQVKTEFFVFCDDDFIFNNETKLETMLDIITETGFDIIGGGYS